MAAFRAGKNASQTGIVSGTNTKVIWETEAFDIGGYFASSIWTPPAGLVIISAGICIGSTNIAATELSVFIYKNGAVATRSGMSVSAAEGGKPSVQLYDIADGDDTYEVYGLLATSTSTGTFTGTGQGAPANYFQGICFSQ